MKQSDLKDFMINMSYADLRAADLDWIARLGYSYGWYI